MTWGIIPAAGNGTRIQPLAFSKELLPVGSRAESGVERPRAVGEYLVERMIKGGADKLCFVISPHKSDILHELHALWQEADRGDEYIGTLVNAWLARGGQAVGVRAGERYVDVGTINGYREAIAALRGVDHSR